MILLSIDPGTRGSATIFHDLRLINIMSFKHANDWRKRLQIWLLVCNPELCAREHVHPWRGQGILTTTKFMRADEAVATLIHAAGVPERMVEPTWWMQRLGLPMYREIEDPGKRRTARRKAQKAMALALYPELKAWDHPMPVPGQKAKETPDIWASPLIGRAVMLDLLGTPLGQLEERYDKP